MADSDNLYLWQLTAGSDITDSDIIYFVDDPGGTPVHSYITHSDLFAGAGFLTTTSDVGMGAPLDGYAQVMFNFEGKLNAQTGTTYEVVSSDNGLYITLNNASAITVTIDEALPAGFNCTMLQKGAGQVSLTAEGSGNLRNYSGHTKLAGQYAVASIFIESNAGTAPEIYFQGETST
jgi:hypothetical protein